MTPADEVLQFWGKARANDEAVVTWHPVAYHLLDVAAVMARLLEVRPHTRRRAAWLLGTNEMAAGQLLVAFAALHDIGKFAPRFQALASPSSWSWPNALTGVDASRYEKSIHTIDGLLWWEKFRSEFADRIWGQSGSAMQKLECAVFCHHGRPVDFVEGRHIGSVFSAGAVGFVQVRAGQGVLEFL